jgi:dimethylamine--corrinoid protein Co-methyltransferase
MQISRGMKIDTAKAYVAERLGASPGDLTDVTRMNEIREDLQLGTVLLRPGKAKAMEAKFRIAEILGIKINSTERFKERAGWMR